MYYGQGQGQGQGQREYEDRNWYYQPDRDRYDDRSRYGDRSSPYDNR